MSVTYPLLILRVDLLRRISKNVCAICLATDLAIASCASDTRVMDRCVSSRYALGVLPFVIFIDNAFLVVRGCRSCLQGFERTQRRQPRRPDQRWWYSPVLQQEPSWCAHAHHRKRFDAATAVHRCCADVVLVWRVRKLPLFSPRYR